MKKIKNIKLIEKLLLIITGPLIILLVLEVGFRTKAYIENKKYLKSEIISRVPSFGELVTLEGLVQLSKNKLIIYELIPNIIVQFPNQFNTVKVNEWGFRGNHLAREKKQGVKRVLGLGDSVMFGMGVGDSSEYFSLLGNKLNANNTPIRWETINTAVPGYNTAMELEVLKAKGLQHNPDYVVMHFVTNDLSLPNFIKRNKPVLSSTKSFFFSYLSYGYNLNTVSNHILIDAPFTEIGENGLPSSFLSDPDDVPSEYQGLVGWDAFRRSIEELDYLSQKHHFKVIMVFSYAKGSDLKQRALEASIEQGFTICDTEQVVEKYMLNNKITNYLGSPLTVSKTDGHPSDLQHKIIAKELAMVISDIENKIEH